MKILIVDDSLSKIALLTAKILEHDGTVEILSATDARAGFKLAEEVQPHLVLLDVVLPLTAVDTPSETGSLWFVKRANTWRTWVRPPIIVGVTSYAESIARVQNVFRSFAWDIILVSENAPRWVRQLWNVLRFAKTARQELTVEEVSPQLAFDVAVVTALSTPEFSELVDALGGGDPLTVKETGERWLQSTITSQSGKSIRVIAACAEDMGMTAMASLVTRVCFICRPKILVLVGIAAGNSERVKLSDLIIVNSTWDCRAGKLTEDGFHPDVQSRDCDFKIANQCAATVDEEFRSNFWRKWEGSKPSEPPSLYKGAVACSSSVIADENIFLELETQRRKIYGLEMEAYGCYDAARRLGDLQPRVVCMKSVCDFGDGSKNDIYQQYCAALAAQAVVHVLTNASLGL